MCCGLPSTVYVNNPVMVAVDLYANCELLQIEKNLSQYYCTSSLVSLIFYRCIQAKICLLMFAQSNLIMFSLLQNKLNKSYA